MKEMWRKGLANIYVGPTEAFPLKGVQYAAKKFVTYTVNGAKREQTWIYGFTEPHQVLILYTILEGDREDGSKDRQDMKQILDSFVKGRAKRRVSMRIRCNGSTLYPAVR